MVWISVQSYSKFYLFKWWKLCATRIRISFIHEKVLIRIHFSSFNFQQIKTAMKKKLSNSVIQKLYTGNYHILWLSFTGEECMKIHAHSPQEKCIVWNLFFSLSKMQSFCSTNRLQVIECVYHSAQFVCWCICLNVYTAAHKNEKNEKKTTSPEW